jgi:hypothetical protein
MIFIGSNMETRDQKVETLVGRQWDIVKQGEKVKGKTKGNVNKREKKTEIKMNKREMKR